MEKKEGVNGKLKTRKTKAVYDVIIIGGCITGVTTALTLQQNGLNVALLEYSEIGFLTSGCYTTHLNTYFDALNNDIIQTFSARDLDLYSKGGLEALTQIKDNINRFGLECELEEAKSYIYSTNGDEDKLLEKIIESCNRVNLPAKLTAASPFKFQTTKIAAISNQHTINAVKYILGLLEQFRKAGGLVIERCRVLKIEFGKINQLLTSRGKISGEKILYTPQTSRLLNLSPYKFIPYIHYSVSSKLVTNANELAISYDLQEPCHRFISNRHRGADFMVIRGEDHRVVKGKVREDYFQKLTKLLKENYTIDVVLAKWSYVYYKSQYGSPVIEQIKSEYENLYISAGYNPDGMILAALGSKIICDLILGRSNKYKGLFQHKKQTASLAAEDKAQYSGSIE
ncbi:hypothetical protein A8C56_07750 [Niabella ginsenosidivorans]|uniref:FAD dependent oxidoreductase domain-containing protein n=1 Tax=Niabella ginsenosidivorans TaxID=1176587 RepID=A0A1A9HZS6_9BACT|nr:FAD-binding oxidoreductase [Niabella ginsenosidivorans]ANH80886.1 hypothetical protein A8C56_07750 [Niabella ginsenosidivorans]